MNIVDVSHPQSQRRLYPFLKSGNYNCCKLDDLLYLSGRTDRTDSTGEDELNISKMIFGATPLASEGGGGMQLLPIESYPQFIATPSAGTEPALLTVEFRIKTEEVPDPYVLVSMTTLKERSSKKWEDTKVIVRSWSLDGNPKPGVRYSWFCVTRAALMAYWEN